MNEQLRESVVAGELERVRSLVDAGVDVNAACDGETVLTYAVSESFGDEGSLARVRTLLAVGARVAAETLEDGFATSVHRAARWGLIATLRALLEADGRAALGKFDDFACTPLSAAAEKGHVEAVRLLLLAGSNVDAQNEEQIGETAITYAIWPGPVTPRHVETVKLLLEFGASPDVRGWMNVSARMHAADWQESETPELMRTVHELFERVAPR